MKNFVITSKEDEKKYWISRAMAVAVVIIGTGGEEPVFLVSQRGPGCPDHIGKWSFTCGYLDWDETLRRAAGRETYEEMSLTISEESLALWKIVDSPDRDARQNVVFRFIARVPLSELEESLKTGVINNATWSRGGEADEVSDIKLVPLSEVDQYEWAFNHRELISEVSEVLEDSRWVTLKGMTNFLFSWKP